MNRLQHNSITLTKDNKLNSQLNINNNTIKEKTTLNTNNVKFNLIPLKNINDRSLQNQISEKVINNQFINKMSRNSPLLKKGQTIQTNLNSYQKSINIKVSNNLYNQKKDGIISTNNIKNKISNSNDDKYSTIKINSKNIKKKRSISNNSNKKNLKESTIINTKKDKKREMIIHSVNSKNAKNFTLKKKTFECSKNFGDKNNNLSNFSLNVNSINNKKNLNKSVKQNQINENKEKNIYKENNHLTSYTLNNKRKQNYNNLENIKINNIGQYYSNTTKKKNKIIKNVAHKKIIRSKNIDKKRKVSNNKNGSQRDGFSESSIKIKKNIYINNEKNTILSENNASKKLHTIENHNIRKKSITNNLILNKKKLLINKSKIDEDSFPFCDIDSENKNKVNIIKTNEFDINKPKDKSLKYTLFKEFEDETNEDKSISNSKIRNIVIGKIDSYKDIVESDKLNKIYNAQRLKNFYDLKSDKIIKNQNNSELNRITLSKIDNNTLILNYNPNNEIENFDLYNNYNDLCVKNKDDTNSNTILLPLQVSKISYCKDFDENDETYKYKEKIDNDILSLINDNNIFDNNINKKCHNVLINKRKHKKISKKTPTEKKEALNKPMSHNSKNSVRDPDSIYNKKKRMQKVITNKNNFSKTIKECPRVREIKLVEINNCDDDSKNYYNINSEKNFNKNDIIADEIFKNKKIILNAKTINEEYTKNFNKKYQIETNHGNEEKCIIL